MTVRMRHTKGHTRNRRAHHALKSPRLSKCSTCTAMHPRHTMCTNCGTYRGRAVVDAKAQATKKALRTKRKNKAMGVDTSKKVEE